MIKKKNERLVGKNNLTVMMSNHSISIKRQIFTDPVLQDSSSTTGATALKPLQGNNLYVSLTPLSSDLKQIVKKKSFLHRHQLII